MYDDFYNLWNQEQIAIIADLLKLADKQTDKETKTSFIEAIDSIIKNKEKIIRINQYCNRKYYKLSKNYKNNKII